MEKMKKHYSGAVVSIRGTARDVERTVWTDGDKYYIKLFGEVIEVTNPHPGVTAGWKTVGVFDTSDFR